MRFLIDECLSIDLVSASHQAGYDAQHVAHIGKAGWKDWNVAHHACENDFIVVTNNASDFRRIYAALSLHPGLVIVLPNVGRETQTEIFRLALDQLDVGGEPINRVLEADLADGKVTFRLYTLPPDP
jgi:predicted nuclease of predicted toxin-antitoxin system